MLSFVIPARNRPDELARTLRALSDRPPADEEVLVIDNASDPPLVPPAELSNGTPVVLLRLDENQGAAARNLGVQRARGDWIVMLDDDSAPTVGDLAATCHNQPPDVAAFGGEIALPNGERESGGLPEVIIGCGCAIRRNAFLEAGGYDPAFNYYAEEYDLCARFIAMGHRVTHTTAVRFLHRKTPTARSMDLILGRLVRNNCWTIRRYAPAHLRADFIEHTIDRYRRIAEKENALNGFTEGLAQLEQTIDSQPNRTMPPELWDRFTGLAATRDHLGTTLRSLGLSKARLVGPGKGAQLIEQVLHESGIVADPNAPTPVIGTLSPGPMLDARDAEPDALTPWSLVP